MIDTSKVCSTCKIEKLFYDFSKCHTNRDGYLYVCKKCAKDAFKRSVDTIPGKLRNIQTSSKNSAKSHGWEYDLTYDFLVDLLQRQDYKCALTGDILTSIRHNPNTISLDRIDSCKGYTKDNVHFVTKTVNICKNKININDFKTLCRKVTDRDKLQGLSNQTL